MLPKSKYLNKFFLKHRPITLSSAKKIIKLFPNYFNPKLILDIGCGTGEWIKTFNDRYSSCKFIGIDGHWINSDDLIYKNCDFLNIDLNSELSSETFNKKYDLVCCLETITDLTEHKGQNLIKKICNITDMCLFSSGTPVQTHGPHKNQQWQSYWHSLFIKNEFTALDFIRPAIWNDIDVGPWYRQNCFLFVKKSWLKNNPEWQNLTLNQQFPIDIVHPEVAPLIKNMRLKQWLRLLPNVFRNTFKNR